MPAISRFRFLLFLVALAILTLARPLAPSAAIQPGPGKGWLMIASRSSAADAITLARNYAARFPSVVVFSSSSGYYGVALGWADTARGEPLRRSLIASGAVPSDAYFSAGARLLNVVWTPSNAQAGSAGQFFAATDLLGGSTTLQTASPPPATPAGRPGYVTGLNPNGDNYLSLRTGPGTRNREIARMRPDTQVTIIGNSRGWYHVSLANGMNGWAYGKYIAPGPSPDTTVPMVGPVASAPAPEIGPKVGPQTPTQRQAVPATEPSTLPATGQQASEPRQDVASKPPEPSVTVQPEKPVAIGDQKRVALVIGNSAYQNAPELPNPRNDAAAMADKLSSLGFQVVTSLDANKTQMELAVREFVQNMSGADVALLFYAGHGMQVNGVNYLIPVDARLADKTALDFETIDLDTILGFMNRENRISIALLDACRDNPLSRRFTRSLGATRSAFIGRGLAAPKTGSGQILIGFATAPGDVAQDGKGDHSPFTRALLDHISDKGLEVELMLKRVKQEVFEMTDRSQEPWNNSALRKDFYFNPG